MSLNDYDIRIKIRNGEPIEYKGLIFYPFRMFNYEEFLRTKPVIELRLNTLPVKYKDLDYITTITTMELERIEQEKKSIGLLEQLLTFLTKALHLNLSPSEKMEMLKFERKEDKLVVKGLEIKQNENISFISAECFCNEIRPLLAKQNGIELPDESINPELVRDYEMEKEYYRRNSKVVLDTNIDDLLASVAVNLHKTIKELNNLTVYEFELLRKAINRNKNYEIYTQARLTGFVSFEKGKIPYASWEFDNKSENNFGLVPLNNTSIGKLMDKKN